MRCPAKYPVDIRNSLTISPPVKTNVFLKSFDPLLFREWFGLHPASPLKEPYSFCNSRILCALTIAALIFRRLRIYLHPSRRRAIFFPIVRDLLHLQALLMPYEMIRLLQDRDPGESSLIDFKDKAFE